MNEFDLNCILLLSCLQFVPPGLKLVAHQITVFVVLEGGCWRGNLLSI